MAKLCGAGAQLRDEIDRLWPRRDRRSDGWVADARHVAAGTSDHIPNKQGVVYAIDVDADLDPDDKRASWRLAEQLRKLAKTDGRIKYIVHQGKITSGSYAVTRWKWRVQKGDPHMHHIHISFVPGKGLDDKPFKITK